MPLENQLAHRNIQETSLAYKTYVSPTLSEPFFVSGSTDILTSGRGYFERRPGFAVGLEATPTAFNSVQRIFQWNRWDGTFIWMVCDKNASNQSVVYKMVVGTDANFVSIWTDTASATPFDFVVSNNTVYFGNGNTIKKWDPTNGLSNWGIAAPTVAPTLSTDGNYAGTAAGTNWTIPTNSQSSINQTYAVYNAATQDYLKLTNYQFTVAPNATITGIIVNVCGHGTSTTAAQRQIDVALTTDGATVAGTAKLANTLNLGTDTTFQLGGAGDLWGNTSLSSAQVTASTFGVLIRDSDVTAAEIDIDAVNVVVYWTSSVGNNSQVGWKYQTCYGNSATGHVSSPSATSTSSGLITNSSVGVVLSQSVDAQVNQIKTFRSTDGGGGNYFETQTSPYSNVFQTIYDGTTDVQLNVNSVAPYPTFNDPPPNWKGVVYWHGRIWGFVNNKVWFTGLEEITIGVPEESVPSGISGNFWQFDQNVTGLAPLQDALAVFCPGRIYVITGDTLDTFRRTLLTNRRGTRQVQCISVLGKMVAWLDTANQLWASDGDSMNEIGLEIRPDLAAVTPASCSMTFHVSGNYHWLVFSTGSKIFIYDMDAAQWMPPWTVAAQYVFSGETSAGVVDLVASIGNKLYKMSTTAHNDNAAAYTWTAVTSPFNMVPDFGKRFSMMATGMYDEPSRLGVPYMVGVERNTVAQHTVSVLVDDDPTATSSRWIDVTGQLATVEKSLQRTQGLNVVQDVYEMYKPAGRRMAVKLVGATSDTADKVYSLFIAYKEQR